MRVLVLVLASRGGAYDGMRRAWSAARARAPPGVTVRFLYGGDGDGGGGDGGDGGGEKQNSHGHGQGKKNRNSWWGW